MHSTSAIHDNRSRAAAGDFLKQHIRPGSELSFVSAYFTVHAYAALQDELESAAGLRFLFGDPTSVSSIDKDDKQARQFTLGPEGHALELENQLQQERIARECAAWIRRQVEIRTITRTSFLHGKLYHVTNAFVRAGEIETLGRGLQRIFETCNKGGRTRTHHRLEAKRPQD